MIYERFSPSAALSPFILCYWWIDSEGDTTIGTQKIIPDGFPEVIFHYGDTYEIKLGETWERQKKTLLAGQIRHSFYLQNTGVSGMIGLKFQPTGLYRLFGLSMDKFTNTVVELPKDLSFMFEGANNQKHFDAKAFVQSIDQRLLELLEKKKAIETVADQAIARILATNGMVNTNDLANECHCSTRQLERTFKKAVGLSPKFYCRIIRLGYIFKLMSNGDPSWSDLVYQSGFYDQSHFIKDFKEFTGEDPSKYGFDEENMANFHLDKR